jgi:anti-anti-sigma regulatory factor
MTETTNNAGFMITLPAEVTLQNAQQLAHRFLPVAGDCKDLVVDFGSVEELDLAGIQLILSARRTIESRGFQLVVRDSKDGIWQRNLALTGLESEGVANEDSACG